MSDPSSFVSFADYLGLNEESLARDRARADASYTGPREQQIQDLSTRHYRDATGNENQAQYDASGEAVRKATATYDEYLRGMADPAQRQALMERVYGKGHVSALESELVGQDRGANTAAQQSLGQLQHRTEEEGMRGDEVMASNARGAKMTADYDAAMRARKQAAHDAAQAQAGASAAGLRQRNEQRFGDWLVGKQAAGGSEGTVSLGHTGPDLHYEAGAHSPNTIGQSGTMGDAAKAAWADPNIRQRYLDEQRKQDATGRADSYYSW